MSHRRHIHSYTQASLLKLSLVSLTAQEAGAPGLRRVSSLAAATSHAAVTQAMATGPLVKFSMSARQVGVLYATWQVKQKARSGERLVQTCFQQSPPVVHLPTHTPPNHPVPCCTVLQLIKNDLLSKSDPIVVLYEQDSR